MELLKTNKKLIIGLSAGLVVVLMCAFTWAGSTSTATGAETVYRESTVERGDIIVGVTETASASLKNHALSFDIAAQLDEVYVKAGQAVKTGDKIAAISTDSINEKINELNAEYQEAALKLSEAQLAKQEGALTAKSKYNTAINASQSADGSYEITVEKLESSVESLTDSITEIDEEIKRLAHLLNYIEDYDHDYESYSVAKQTYEDAKKQFTAAESALESFKYEYGNGYKDAEEYDELAEKVDSTQRLYRSARSNYNAATERFDANYDERYPDEASVTKAQKQAQESLLEAQWSLKEAQMKLDGGSAEQSREEDLEKAALAGTTYELQLQSLANSVTSKQLALSNIQEQIDKYTAYLEKTVITAPCNGVVTAVSHDAGDELQAGAAVATVSNNASVFVGIVVTQDDITGVSLGQTCSVTMDAFEELPFDGIVDSITTTPARSASGTPSYTVSVKLSGDTAKVYEGMSGSATLITRQQKDVLYVTTRTVYSRDGQSYVKVKQDDGAAQETAVTTGFSDGRNVEITDGLSEGQTVLIESQVTA